MRRTAAMLGFLIAAGSVRAAEAGGDKEGLAVGDSAPSFSLKTLNPKASGRTLLALRRHVGENPEEPKKSLILSFSASYCEPCKKEMAELKKLAPRFEKAGALLAIVIIDTDDEGIEKMRKFSVDELGLSYPVLSDRFNIVARRYKAESLPHVVVIDTSGKVEWIHSGADPAGLESLLKLVGA